MSNLMVVTHNLQSMFADRHLGIVSGRKKKSTEKLASGYKINRAADDAAGLTISEKMRSLVRGLSQGVENTQDGISMCQIADGALEEVHDMIHRITELSVKASNGTNTVEDRQAIQSEINSLLAEIDRVSESTEFNTMPIFKIGPDIDSAYKDEIDISDDEVINQLANGRFPTIAGDIVDNGKTVLTADEANGLLHMLSNQALAIERYNNPIDYTEENKSKMKEDYLLFLHNLAYFAKFDVDSPQKANDFFAELESIANTGFSYEVGSSEFNAAFSSIVSKLNHAAVHVDGDNRTYTNFNMDKEKYGLMQTSQNPWQSFQWLNQGLYEPANKDKGISLAANHQFAYVNYLGIKTGYIRELSGGMSKPDTTIPEKIPNTAEMYRYICNHELETNPGVWIQSGAHDGDGMYIQFGRIDTGRLGIGGIDASTESGARNAIESSKKAVNKVSKLRSHIGAQQNRLEHTVANENNIVENTQAAESRIRDTDMPAEMVKNAKENILEQVGHSVLAQANQSTQGVLTLLNR